MNKKLQDYTEEEWEAVCTRCGKCCLLKLEDEDTGDIWYTDIVCRYFDIDNCACTIYDKRCQLVPACLKLTRDNVDKISWMPDSCAYRRLVEGRPPAPHTTIKGRCISEDNVREEDYEDHIVDWKDL